jgi:hypothetical protein
MRVSTHRNLRRVARLVVPVALAVTAISVAASALSGTVGCGDDSKPDAKVGDGGPDTPII